MELIVSPYNVFAWYTLSKSWDQTGFIIRTRWNSFGLEIIVNMIDVPLLLVGIIITDKSFQNSTNNEFKLNKFIEMLTVV